MNKKTIWMTLGGLAILGGGAYFAMPAMEESAVMKVDTMKEKEFQKYEELQVQIIDTAGLSDKNLSKWVEENQGKKGEHLYFDNKNTYVLITPGEGEDNTTIWFDGMKKLNDDTLIVGYKLVDGSEVGVKPEKGVIRTMLISTEGEFKKTKTVEVEREEQPIQPAVKEQVEEEKDETAEKDEVTEKESVEKTESKETKEKSSDKE
ncbi:hypothetical protein JMA_42190 (plasmid) [Jeotgalibacillus malaysiensis]|uniref:Uncharacterized protein n=1 Tax=Jeotgalibacillus malaysiensis TaxID=1508404 RepID=A0A0B5ATY5_9BACL|nr:hypothetical protein [Jeotgalibacillus malaysiensis]AJD93536.1 hypothetical protein JMA_42190 [Jeotgalibacillus malaysiensis]